MFDTAKLKALLVNDNGFGFDPASGHTYNLSLTALEVIRLLKEGADDAEIRAVITQEYDVDQVRADRDLDAFTSALLHYGLLQPTTEEG